MAVSLESDRVRFRFSFVCGSVLGCYCWFFFYCDPILFLRLRLIGFPCWLLIGSFSLRWLRVIFFLFFFWVYCVERGFIGGFIVPFCLSIVAKVGVDWTIFELFLLFGSFSLSNRLLIESSD